MAKAAIEILMILVAMYDSYPLKATNYKHHGAATATATGSRGFVRPRPSLP